MVKLNNDNGQSRMCRGGNVISAEAVDYIRADVRYKHSLSQNTKVTVSAWYNSENIQLRTTNDDIGSSFIVALERKW